MLRCQGDTECRLANEDFNPSRLIRNLAPRNGNRYSSSHIPNKAYTPPKASLQKHGQLVNAVAKVNHDCLFNQVANTLDEGLVSRVRFDVVVPIFGGGELDNEAMGYSILRP